MAVRCRHRGDRGRAAAALTRAAAPLALAALAAATAGCGGALRWEEPAPPATHTVRRGETLYEIAWAYRLDYRDVAAWNGLGDGSLIHPGQVLSLRPASRPRSPASTGAGSRGPAPSEEVAAGSSATREASRPAAPGPAPQRAADPPPAWSWPVSGPIVSEFGSSAKARTGVLIAGRQGQEVRAAAPGRIVYAGSGLIGYGQLIIIKHNETYLSAYGHNEAVLVRENELVAGGQRIARMGEGPGQQPRLHFEIRRNGKPIDPRRFLPASR